MRLILVLIVLLLAIFAVINTSTSVAAEKPSQLGKPGMPVLVPGGFSHQLNDNILRMGTPDELQYMEASELEKALQEGKPFVLFYTRVTGHVNFRGTVKNATFIGVEFSGRVDFTDAIFSGSSFFAGDRTTFVQCKFSDVAIFAGAKFQGIALFDGSEFHDTADFGKVQFLAFANFMFCKFLKWANFRDAKFSGEARFMEAKFSELDGWAQFMDAEFLKHADFKHVVFYRDAFFYNVEFSGRTRFTWCKFMRISDFRGCLYPPHGMLLFTASSTYCDDLDRRRIPDFQDFETNWIEEENIDLSIIEKGKAWQLVDRRNRETFLIQRDGSEINVYSVRGTVRFASVMGFHQMLIEWDYEPSYAAADNPSEMQRRGLRGHLGYDEPFYVTLVSNCRAIGRHNQAQDIYYDYRKKRRKMRVGFFGKLSEFLFLEFSFGYGVKPWNLLRSFLVLWISFSLYYTGFIRRPENWFLSGVQPWNPLRDRGRCLAWAIIHSFNILTPGIDLQSMRYMKASRYELMKAQSKRVIWVQRAQQILGWYLLALFLILFGKLWIR